MTCVLISGSTVERLLETARLGAGVEVVAAAEAEVEGSVRTYYVVDYRFRDENVVKAL